MRNSKYFLTHPNAKVSPQSLWWIATQYAAQASFRLAHNTTSQFSLFSLKCGNFCKCQIWLIFPSPGNRSAGESLFGSFACFSRWLFGTTTSTGAHSLLLLVNLFTGRQTLAHMRLRLFSVCYIKPAYNFARLANF